MNEGDINENGFTRQTVETNRSYFDGFLVSGANSDWKFSPMGFVDTRDDDDRSLHD